MLTALLGGLFGGPRRALCLAEEKKAFGGFREVFVWA